MKLQSKLSCYFCLMLLVLLVGMVLLGSFVLNEVLYGLHSQLLRAELNLVDLKLDESYQVLKDSKLDDVEAYRKSARKELIEQLRHYKFANAASLHVYDSRGMNLLRSSCVPQEKTLEMMRKAREGEASFYSPTKRHECFGVYKLSESWDLLLVLTIPREQLLAQLWKYIELTSRVGFVVLVVTLLIAYRFSRKITSNIDSMLECVDKVAKGDLDGRIELPRGVSEEFKGLEHGINAMVDKLQKREIERKLASLELQKHQKMESIGLLAGGIAHDFNNILTAILGNIQLAHMQLIDKDDNACVLLQDSEDAVSRAMELTRQLLMFAKGGAPTKKTSLISEVLESTANFALRGTKSNCSFEFAPDLKPVDMDVGQISQVVQNLVINANQAMPDGGTVRLGATMSTIEERSVFPLPPGEYVRLTVTDDGEGIEPDELNRIFEPFFSTKQEGSGLGLATSYSIIKRHNGYITAESKKGVGSNFIIYLPASSGQLFIEETTEEDIFKGSLKVLIMDDQDSIRQLLGRMMEQMGCVCEFAPDGERAIELYSAAMDAEKPFDVVFMDLTIPGAMGGKKAFERIKEIDPEVVAVVASGYINDEVMLNYSEFGFKAKVAKPFKIAEISEILKSLFSA